MLREGKGKTLKCGPKGQITAKFVSEYTEKRERLKFEVNRAQLDRQQDIEFEVFRAVTMKNAVFWDVVT
jgi:hypothetical protein